MISTVTFTFKIANFDFAAAKVISDLLTHLTHIHKHILFTLIISLSIANKEKVCIQIFVSGSKNRNGLLLMFFYL